MLQYYKDPQNKFSETPGLDGRMRVNVFGFYGY